VKLSKTECTLLIWAGLTFLLFAAQSCGGCALFQHEGSASFSSIFTD
jgi:hypothetical protein